MLGVPITVIVLIALFTNFIWSPSRSGRRGAWTAWSAQSRLFIAKHAEELRVVAGEKRPRRANEAPLKAANDYDCFAAWLERDDCLNVDAW